MKDGFLRVGASYQLFNYEKQSGDEDKNYNTLSVFATNYNKLQLLPEHNTILTESIRYDKNSEFEDAFTGKVGLKQFVYKDYYVGTNIGTGFNAPTIGQIYGEYGSLANPNLKPETSFTADVTVGNDTLWITAFYNEIDNLIVWSDPDGWGGNPAIYDNISGKSKFQGVEVTYEDYLFDTLGLGANYTYVQTEDAEGKELARRPKSQLEVHATYYVSDDFDISANAQYIGERYDQADKQGAQTGKYTVVNFVSNVKVNKYITVYGKINNIADKYYQVVDGYATAGRSLYFGLNAKY
jgi:vitamin B12 transporter